MRSMEIFRINKFLKHLIIRNTDMGLERKLDLIKEMNYPNLTGIQTLKAIEGIVNYGIVIDIDLLLQLPNVDCIYLNTGIEMMLNHYSELSEEEIKEAIDLLLSINIDRKKEGFKTEDLEISGEGIIDILQDYVMESRVGDKNIGANEISLYGIEIDYKDKETIREFTKGREIFN